MRKIIVLFVATLFVLSSCNNSSSSKSKSVLDTSLGKTHEMLVVMTSGGWESILGDTVRAMINHTSPWLVVDEPLFEVSWVTPDHYNGLYLKYRNVLLVEINEHIAENKVTVQKNATAKPQAIVTVKVKSIEEGLAFYASHHEQIMEIFKKEELNRVVGAYEGIQDHGVSREVRERFGFNLVIPKGFYTATNDSNFMWLRKPTRHIDEGIIIYRYPYTDTSDFRTEKIVKMRNEITKARIPGPVDSSYMKVSDVFIPYTKTLTFKNQYAKLVRSWWDVTKYPMGGPYLSYTFVDPTGEYLICIDGYIHAPKKAEKRNIILHLESIFDSFEYVNPEK